VSSEASLDVAVVGAGPAGLAAGIHLARADLLHRVFEGGRPGGLLHHAGLVECYPGFPGGIPGRRLAAQMLAQAQQLGVVLVSAEVSGLAPLEGGFELVAGGRRLRARAVILATGTRPRPLPPGISAPGLDPARLCHGTADLPLDVAGRRIWISGGGDAAFDSALQLVERGALVSIAMRREHPRSLPLLVRRAVGAGVALHPGWALARVAPGADGLSLCFAGSAGRMEVPAFALLVCHGRLAEDALWRDPAGTSQRPVGSSPVPGLFLAGDLVNGDQRYAGVAVGDGLRCARLAEAHAKRYRGGSTQLPFGTP
jgi:thioredoxin reductase (NADPH)